MTLAIASGLEMDFSSTLLPLSLSNAFIPTSSGWRSCLSLLNLKAWSNGYFCVCQWCPSGTALPTGESCNTGWFEGHRACQPETPQRPMWNSSRGSLVLLLKITLLFWLWILLAPLLPFPLWNNCFPTWLLRTQGFLRFQQLCFSRTDGAW